MYSLLALVVTTLTACVIAHPGGVREGANDPLPNELLQNGPSPENPNRNSIRDYLLRYMRSVPAYVANEEQARIPYPRPQMPVRDWLNEEIDRINQMQERAPKIVQYKTELPSWIYPPYKRIIYGPDGSYGARSVVSTYFEYPFLTSKSIIAAGMSPRKHAKILHPVKETTDSDQKLNEIEPHSDRKIFALTPRDEGYFEPTEKDNSSYNPMVGMPEGLHEGGGHESGGDELGPRRQIRQNPISRTKTLVTEDLDKLRIGVDSDDADSKDKPQHYRVLGSQFATGTIYAVGIAVGVGTAIILAILGFAFGWYALSKRAKAAADVDYPAYGVTGPTMDTSGDRKLAHSAQMYHYQHQKQQIIAMERINVEQRNGSVSDPESEEENEEGDYTVYECPGFATTGDMEVKNPLFNEEPTPATPGNIEVVKPQPKE